MSELWEQALARIDEFVDVNTTREALIDKIKLETSGLSAKLPDGQTYIYYGGGKTYDTAKLVARDNLGAGWIEQTAAGKLLSSDDLNTILDRVFGGDDQARKQAMQFDIDSPWDQASARYADHASGKVIVISLTITAIHKINPLILPHLVPLFGQKYRPRRPGSPIWVRRLHRRKTICL